MGQNTIIRLAQILSALFVVVLGGAGLVSMLSPLTIAEPSGFNPVGDYGITNMRTLGAPTLALAIITAIGAFRKDWLLILPAAMYFILNASARIISVFVEGFEPIMTRGLVFTLVLVALSQVALHIFRRSQANAT